MFRHLRELRQSCKGLISYIIFKHNTFCTMNTDIKLNFTGVPLKQVVDTMQQFADLSLAASWDNVGLLIEPTETKLISHILLTNDLTENVMQEALDLKTDMIITYHPLIFAPLKSVTTHSWKVIRKFVTGLLNLYFMLTTIIYTRIFRRRSLQNVWKIG